MSCKHELETSLPTTAKKKDFPKINLKFEGFVLEPMVYQKCN